MKTVIKLDVSDAQRQALSCLLAGKQVKRLASRDDVAAFVLGMMAGLSRVAPEPADLGEPTPAAARVVDALRAPLSPAEQAEARRLLAEGKTEGYIRGWITVGRRLAQGARI